MAPMGIRLSPLGVAVFVLLGLGVIYHLYAGVISSHLAVFRQKKVDLRDLLALAVQSAEEGGIEVKRVREHNTLEEKSKGKTKEGAIEFLTQGDLSSHKKMYYLIKNTYTDLQVNSEEHDDSVGDDRLWDRHIPDEILQKVRGGQEVAADRVTVWIDPLDATQEYTENLLQYVTTMVCVAVDGKPVIGVIHNPFSAYTAWAYVGEGTNVRTRSSYSLSPPRVIVSRSHAGKVQKFVHNTFGQNTTIIPAGGAGYKVLSLLEPSPKQKEIDQADIYMHITLIKKWDICAGAAILSALGGQMTTLDGKDIDYHSSEVSEGGLVATVGLDHKALLEKLSDWEAYKY